VLRGLSFDFTAQPNEDESPLTEQELMNGKKGKATQVIQSFEVTKHLKGLIAA